MKYYTFPPSSNCRKVHAVIRHLGIDDIDIELMALPQGATRTPEYLSMNPMGRVPLLVDGDLKLWESNAICLYLCDRRGDTDLLPADPKRRADITRWLFWESAHWHKATGTLTFEVVAKRLLGLGEPDAARVKQAEEEFRGLATILNHHFEDKRFLTGDRATLADFIVGAMLTHAEPARMPVGEYRRVADWYARLGELDAWKKTAPQPLG